MTRTLALLFTLTATTALATPVHDAPDTSWHMLERQQDGGIAAVLHGLSKHECEFAKARIEGTPATEAEVAAENQRQDKTGQGRWLPYTLDRSTGSDYSYYDYDYYGPLRPPMDSPSGWSGDVGRPYIARAWDSESPAPQTVVSAECFQ